MTCFYRTRITGVGPEVMALLEGGVLILFKQGAPAELAEVSVLHEVENVVSDTALMFAAGGEIRIGDLSAIVTSVGETAMVKVAELGHVVISFNGADEADRPGEICTEEVDLEALKSLLKPGTMIEFCHV